MARLWRIRRLDDTDSANVQLLEDFDSPGTAVFILADGTEGELVVARQSAFSDQVKVRTRYRRQDYDRVTAAFSRKCLGRAGLRHLTRGGGPRDARSYGPARQTEAVTIDCT